MCNGCLSCEQSRRQKRRQTQDTNSGSRPGGSSCAQLVCGYLPPIKLQASTSNMTRAILEL